MNDIDLANNVHKNVVDFQDRLLWMIIGLSALGAAGRNLLSKEPFEIKKFLGELILSIIGAVIVWSFGLMQGMTVPQMIFFGGLSAWGGIRTIEWGLKFINTMQSGTSFKGVHGD